jgi:hypothetical protein
VKTPLAEVFFLPATAPEKLVDGAVLKVLENLIVFVDEVNDWPVGNPKSKV